MDQDITKLTDNELINYIKADDIRANESLRELHSRHNKLYYSSIKKYTSVNSSFEDKEFLLGNSVYVIYKAALSFNTEKKTKFSSFVGLNARWHALKYITKYSKAKSGVHYSDEIFENMNIPMEFSEDYPVNPTEVMKEVKNIGDERAFKIFELRYFSDNGKLMPWKKIAKHISTKKDPNKTITGQGCLNIHNDTIKEIRKKIKNNLLY